MSLPLLTFRWSCLRSSSSKASMAYSTYLRKAHTEPSLLADRGAMLRSYSADMRRLADVMAPPPALSPSCVRLVTWNLNCLRGFDGQSTVAASDIAAVLDSLDADVLALQEVPIDFDPSWGEWLTEPLGRIRELDTKLEALGYTLLLRSPATNPTLLASRLPATCTEGLTLDAQPVRTQNGDAIWSETRGGCFAELELPNSQMLRVYATHLHHKDDELRDEDDLPLPGVRAREATVLLNHWEARRAESAVGMTVVLGDFNQPVRGHYNNGEWDVVVAGLRHPAVAQPEDDGVRQLFEAKGFRCSFDWGAGKNNFDERLAPALTHWTGTTIDFAYVNSSESACHVDGTYVQYSDLSDHAPVIVDVALGDEP